MRPYNEWVHPRRWRAFMEYGNGIVGDMCIHMFDMVRWMLDLGWPQRINSSGGIFVDKKSKSNITDTQTATFAYPEIDVVWQHRTWGEANDREYPWGATLYGDKGTLKVDVHKYEFTPLGQNKPTLSGKALYEYEKYPIDRSEICSRRSRRAASRWPTSSRGISRRPAASWRTCHKSSAGRWCTTPRSMS
jgi:predicted dehydrogenase